MSRLFPLTAHYSRFTTHAYRINEYPIPSSSYFKAVTSANSGSHSGVQIICVVAALPWRTKELPSTTLRTAPPPQPGASAPSLSFLNKIAAALNAKIEVRFVAEPRAGYRVDPDEK